MDSAGDGPEIQGTPTPAISNFFADFSCGSDAYSNVSYKSIFDDSIVGQINHYLWCFQAEFGVEEFEVKKKAKSGVWRYMNRNKARTKALCMVNQCRTIIKTTNSGTSSCRRHLRKAHGIEVTLLRVDWEPFTYLR